MNRTYGHLQLSSDTRHWDISGIEPHVAIRLKQLFPRIPKAQTGTFRLPNTDLMAADIDWFLARYPLKMDNRTKRGLKKGSKAFRGLQADMERILLPEYEAGEVRGLKDGQQLRHYQLQAVDLLRKRKSLLLGDEGGLGKTYVAAGFLCAEPAALPAAVVCDAHMQKQWKQKTESFTELTVHIIKKGSPYNLPKADVYVYRVSQIAKWADIFATGFFKAVVFDEPQSLRTGAHTAKGRAAKVLSENTQYKLGLTATPIYNYGDEMYNVMQFIDPLVLGKWEDFAREWCTALGNGKHRVKDPKALGTYLREQYAMLRRLKSDVGLELPQVSRLVEHVDTDDKAVKSLEETAKQLAIRATTGPFIERGQAARELDIMMRQATGVSKARAVAQFVRLLIEAGEPVLLAGWHRDVYDIWLEAFADLRPAMYTGTESVTKKEKEKARFLDGETDLMIISLRSGAGMDDLQYRCSTVVFGELDWSPGIHQQIIWRLDRDGQENPVLAFFLVSEDGSDPPMMDVNGIKASEARMIVDPELGMERASNDGGNLRKLVQRYLEKAKRTA